jgi:hypothetical protein
MVIKTNILERTKLDVSLLEMLFSACVKQLQTEMRMRWNKKQVSRLSLENSECRSSVCCFFGTVKAWFFIHSLWPANGDELNEVMT